MYGDDPFSDGDFNDDWAARDLEGDGNATPDFQAIAGQMGMQTQPLKTPVFAPIPIVLPITTTTGTPGTSTPGGGDVAVGTPVTSETPQPTLATDDPSLALPETGYRENGNVYVRDEQGNAVQVFPIAGQWQTRGGILARYITTYAAARRAGQDTTAATIAAATAAGYHVPTVEELTRALAVGTGSARYAGPGSSGVPTAYDVNGNPAFASAIYGPGQQVASGVVQALSPQLNALTAAAVYRDFSDRATAEHRRITERDAFRREMRGSIAEILATVHGIAAVLPPPPRRY